MPAASWNQHGGTIYARMMGHTAVQLPCGHSPIFKECIGTPCPLGGHVPEDQKLAVLPKDFIKGKIFAPGQTRTGDLTPWRMAVGPG